MLHIRGVLDADGLARVRGLIGNAGWIDGRATAGHVSQQVKRNRQLDERDPAAIAASALIIAALEAHSGFIAAALPARIVPPLFNRYGVSEAYGPHIDGAIRPLPSAGMVRTDLSATLFLSDEADYAGGELCIRHGTGEHRMRLPAGDLLLYPAGAVHHVSPVTVGERMAAIFWVQSLVRDTTRRDLLHGLDETIQRLTGIVPDAAPIVDLHGLYHNLLRQWADT